MVAAGSGVALVLGAVPALAAGATADPTPSASASTTDAWASAIANPTITPVGTWASAGTGKTAAVSAATAAKIKAATDAGTSATFTPKTVNRTVVGADPTGTWAPSSAQATASGTTTKGTTSAAPAAVLAATGTNAVATPALAGSGAAGTGLGLQSFYGLETFTLADRLTASVNVANGNLVVHSKDASFNAPGLSVNLDTFFNTLHTGNGSFGPGGTFSTGQDIGLQTGTSTTTFYGPSGFTAAFTANGSTWTAPAGINADLVHNSDGTWTLTYRATGEKLTFSSGGYLTKDTDRNGIGLSLAYNSSNQLTSLTDGAGRVTTLAYNANGYITTITDPVGRVTSFAYNTGSSGTGVKTITYADGSVVTFDGSVTGGLDKIQTPDGNWVAFTYDSSGRVTKVQRFTTAGSSSGAAATTSFAYPSSTSTTETNPLGGTSTYTLDSLGRVTKVVDPLGHSKSTTWTPNSDVASTSDGASTPNTTSYTYDTVNNITAVALPTGAAAKAVYATGTNCASTGGSAYQVHCSTDAAGNVTTYSYDAAGNITGAKDTTATASGGTGATPFTYTRQSATTSGTQCGGKAGQVCTSTDGDGHVTSYTYDSSGNLTKVTPPSPLGATTYTYDGIGRLSTVTDGKGQQTAYTYDAANRITKVTTATGDVIKSFYDADGHLLQTQDSAKGTNYWSFDTLGNETWRQPSNAGGNSFTTVRDAAGDITSEDDIYGKVTYAYNNAGQLTSMTEPTGTSGTATAKTTFTYDVNGRETTRTLPNGIVQNTTYDNAGRITRITASNGSTKITDFTYSYTAPGTSGTAGDRTLIQTRTDAVGIGVPAGSTITYSYDGLARLSKAVEKTSTGAVNASWAYTYDAAGNRTAATTVGATTPGATASTASATTNWGYNAANEITSKNGSTTGWASDADGNQTSAAWGSASYDERGALTSLTPTGASSATTFAYAGTGNANEQYENGGGHISSILGLAATFASGSSTGVAFRHTPDGASTGTELPDGTNRYFLTDAQGSVVAVMSGTSSSATYTYDPYGGTRTVGGTEAGDNPVRYTGGYTDSVSSGLYHFGARYYDPASGRFTQSDPSGQGGTTYLYASGSPINVTDPTGLVGCSGTPARGLVSCSSEPDNGGSVSTGKLLGLGCSILTVGVGFADDENPITNSTIAKTCVSYLGVAGVADQVSPGFV